MIDLNLKERCESNCNQNVHNIIYHMMKRNSRYYKNCYVGGLFKNRTEYPIFQGKECVQYLQEYALFHLPQIEYPLQKTLRVTRKPNKGKILDMGSGPGTVPLAFCGFLDSEPYKIDLEITTVEASRGFNEMINIFKKINTNDHVKIIENLCCKFQYFIDNAKKWRGQFNWVIMANCISGIGKSVKHVNRNLNKLLAGLLNPNRRILLTIIESDNSSFLNKGVKIVDLLRDLGTTGFTDIKKRKKGLKLIRKPINASWLENCKCYKTGRGNYEPIINSRSILLELRK